MNHEDEHHHHVEHDFPADVKRLIDSNLKIAEAITLVGKDIQRLMAVIESTGDITNKRLREAVELMRHLR